MKDLTVYCLMTGPGKARAAQGTTALIHRYEPSIVIDSGTCAGLSPVSAIGDIIISYRCYEFDISGTGVPSRKIKEMELESGFRYLPESVRETLICRAGVQAGKLDLRVIEGAQAAGEFLINNIDLKKRLYGLFQAAGGNWETAAVFVSALRASLPALSIRVVSDRGERDALREFRSRARTEAGNLYRFIGELVFAGWFEDLLAEWGKVRESVKKNLPGSVLP